MASIKAIIYDVDGTLVNSEPLHVATWDAALNTYGRSLDDLSETFVRTMAGKKPLVIAAEMVEELGMEANPAIFLERKTDLYLELASQRLEPTRGAIESVRRLHDAGYRLAIGTSLDRTLLDTMLQKLGVIDDFEVIVTGDQITKGKPDPETYRKVCEQLEVLPHECVVLEDAQSGILSAKAAGAWCIAVQNPDAIAQDTSAADMVVNDLGEVTRELVERFSKR